MIFIAKNYDGKVVSIISAADNKSANAYWQGQGLYPHTVTEFNVSEDRDNEKMGYVTPILNTTEKEIYVNNKFVKLIVVT